MMPINFHLTRDASVDEIYIELIGASTPNGTSDFFDHVQILFGNDSTNLDAQFIVSPFMFAATLRALKAAHEYASDSFDNYVSKGTPIVIVFEACILDLIVEGITSNRLRIPIELTSTHLHVTLKIPGRYTVTIESHKFWPVLAALEGVR